MLCAWSQQDLGWNPALLFIDQMTSSKLSIFCELEGDCERGLPGAVWLGNAPFP